MYLSIRRNFLGIVLSSLGKHGRIVLLGPSNKEKSRRSRADDHGSRCCVLLGDPIDLITLALPTHLAKLAAAASTYIIDLFLYLL